MVTGWQPARVGWRGDGRPVRSDDPDDAVPYGLRALLGVMGARRRAARPGTASGDRAGRPRQRPQGRHRAVARDPGPRPLVGTDRRPDRDRGTRSSTASACTSSIGTDRTFERSTDRTVSSRLTDVAWSPTGGRSPTCASIHGPTVRTQASHSSISRSCASIPMARHHRADHHGRPVLTASISFPDSGGRRTAVSWR